MNKTRIIKTGLGYEAENKTFRIHYNQKYKSRSGNAKGGDYTIFVARNVDGVNKETKSFRTITECKKYLKEIGLY